MDVMNIVPQVTWPPSHPIRNGSCGPVQMGHNVWPPYFEVLTLPPLCSSKAFPRPYYGGLHSLHLRTFY